MTTSPDTPERSADDVDEVLQARARALAVPRSAQAADERSAELHLVARIGDRTVAIPAARARHVVPSTPLARLVECGTAISGLAAVHGDLVPIADVSALLQLGGDDGPTQGSHFVVVDDEGSRIGLVVDEVVELRSLHPGDVAADSSGTRSGSITGVAPGGVYVLDLDGLLADSRLWPPGTMTDPKGTGPPR